MQNFIMIDILDPELHNPEDGLNAGLGFYTRNIFTQKKYEVVPAVLPRRLRA